MMKKKIVFFLLLFFFQIIFAYLYAMNGSLNDILIVYMLKKILQNQKKKKKITIGVSEAFTNNLYMSHVNMTHFL